MAVLWEVTTVGGALCLDSITGSPEEPSELFSVWQAFKLVGLGNITCRNSTTHFSLAMCVIFSRILVEHCLSSRFLGVDWMSISL